MSTLFITGIDTDIGKSIACAALANTLLNHGAQLFTQKLVETGCPDGQSVDLNTHQQFAKQPFNLAATAQHSPYTFNYPASPHLAAAMEQRQIDGDYLSQQMHALQQQCQHLLVEGAGGLCVPLNSTLLMIDWVQAQKLPIILVTSAKLGSINHTLLSLAICQQRGIDIRAIIYNQYKPSSAAILADTRQVLQQHINTMMDNAQPTPLWLELESGAQTIALTKEQVKYLLT